MSTWCTLGRLRQCAHRIYSPGANHVELQRNRRRSGKWIVDLGEAPPAALKGIPAEFTASELERWSTVSETPSGRLRHLKPAVQLSESPPYWARPSVPLGYHRPVWP
jgi:hypothetical protein